jgi:hypothetical protein
MSKEIGRIKKAGSMKFRKDFYVNEFYGGAPVGRCYQFTQYNTERKDHHYVTISKEEFRQLQWMIFLHNHPRLKKFFSMFKR